MKTRLCVHMDAAKTRVQPLDHVLLSGPAGTGKSTLANLIGAYLNDPVTLLTMPMDRKTLVRAIQAFNGGILFLDEIHALPKRDQELLLPVLSEKVIIDARGRRYQIPWLTVIGATTERDKLIAPLHGRFQIKPEIAPYTDFELGQIVAGMADRMGITLDQETAVTLGTASGGVPRNAEAFILAYRDLTTNGEGVTAQTVLDLCQVDADGLTEQHRRYLSILSDQGGRAGQKTIEMLLQIPDQIVRELERLLLNRGLIEYGSTGRELTPTGVGRTQGREVPIYVRR